MAKNKADWTPPLKVIPQEFESAHGVMLRLCERNGLTSMNNFEHATGLKMGHVFAGRHLERLAEILDLQPERIASIAFQVQSTKPTLVSGETLRKFDISRKNRRICVECLRENHYQRFWWDLLFITHCPIHHIELVGQCPCGANLSWRDRELSRCRKCRNGSVLEVEPVAVSSPRHFEAWALGRLGVLSGERPLPILQDMFLKDAVNLVTRIGRLHHSGWGRYWLDTDTSDEDLQKYRETGHAIIREKALLDLFDRVHQQSERINGGPPTSMKASLGWFWTWFTHAGGASLSRELAEVIARHFDDRFHIRRPDAGKSLLLGPRSLLSLRELSEQTGTDAGILRSVLIEKNKAVPARQGGAMVISTEAAQWVLESMSDTLEIREAQAFLGVGWRSWMVLRERRWLPVHIDPVTYNSRTTIPFIRKKDLEDWMDDLAAGAAAFSICPDDCSTLSGINRNKNVSFEKLMDRVIEKQVPVVGRIASITGLAALAVRNADIDDLVFRGGGRYCNRVLAEA
jgi:hypothetical protein